MAVPEHSNLNILTGAPGSGKSSLIKGIEALGIHCIEEPARAILIKQLAIDGPHLPEKNPLRFVQAMLNQMDFDFIQSSKLDDNVLFDRGIPDLIAYARTFSADSSKFERAAEQRRYNSRVFLLPPWQEIFVGDDLRTLSFLQTIDFHEELVKAYTALGYQLVGVPKASISKRTQFIQRYLGQGRTN